MKKEMVKKYKAEFHMHTAYSHDSILTKYFLFLVCKIKKIKYIAITDHNEIKGAIKYKKFFEKHGINVIVGEEIFSKDGEIIGLFLEKKINPGLSIEDTVKEIKKQNGIVYVPHPYDEKRLETVITPDALKKIHKDVDLIECHNGRNIKEEFSVKQNEIAGKYKITKIVGSDAHTIYEVGRNYCLVNEINRDNLIEEIKNAEFHKSKCLKIAHKITKVARLIKIVKGGKWNELSRIINKKFKRNR